MKDKIDVQSLEDKRNIAIDRVGVKNVRYPIVVEDRKNKIQHTVANIDIFVDLPHHHRGTHMSRFIEVLNQFHEESFIDNLEKFMLGIKTSLDADSSYAVIKFPYFMKKKAPISNIESIMSYDCYFQAAMDKKFSLIIGAEIPVTTLCPCSKEVSDYGAHNQRSIVSVKVKADDFIWLEEIIDVVESCASCEIYSLLKRSDEKYVTEKAFDNPRFVEDIVREITLKLKKDKRIKGFSVESENFESIHNHNAYACVKNNF